MNDSANPALDLETSAFSRLGWSARLLRARILRKLAALRCGRLIIEDADGTHEISASHSLALPVARVRVLKESFYGTLAAGGSVAAAESWVRGEWSSPDLVAVMRLMAANVEVLNRIDDASSIAERSALRLLHFVNRNSRSGSRRNIEAHYDLGNEMFRQFLDPTMMYSAAIFPHASATLEEASLHKLERICRALELKAGDHLLEIGTGWGGMAEYAARHYGCRVTTTTISREQYEYARERIERAGLADRVTVLCRDYRDLEGQYDKLVSIEMIEAVGHQYLPQYFATCSRLLKPHGLMLLQSILIPDQRYARALKSVDFIQRYIFPGGFLPCTGEILRQVGARTDMQLIDTLDITAGYAATLAHWRARFSDSQPQLDELGYGADFQRLWDFYFAYCEGGFRERAIATAQFLFAKPDWRASATA